MTEHSAEVAAVKQRVTGLEKSLAELATSTARGFDTVRSETADMGKQLFAGINQLQAAIAGGSKTQWPVVWSAAGFTLAMFIAIGTLAYRPIEAAQVKFERQLEKVDEQLVPRVEHTERWRRYERDQDKIDRRIERLEHKIFP